jgi:hypothetical protein
MDERGTIVSSFSSFEYNGHFDSDSQNYYSGKDRNERLALGLFASFVSALVVWLNSKYFNANIGKGSLEEECSIYLLLIEMFYKIFVAFFEFFFCTFFV